MGHIEIDGVKIRTGVGTALFGPPIRIPHEYKNNQLNRELCSYLYVLYYLLMDLSIKRQYDKEDLLSKYYTRYVDNLQVYILEYKKYKGIPHPHEQELIAHVNSFKDIHTSDDMRRVAQNSVDINSFIFSESPYYD